MMAEWALLHDKNGIDLTVFQSSIAAIRQIPGLDVAEGMPYV